MITSIIRSKRRRKTVQARVVGNVLEVRAPATMSDRELEPFIQQFQRRAERRRARATLDDGALQARAVLLNQRYFSGRLRWTTLRWVTNQTKRFGSCTPSQGAIRISHRIAAMPRFVQDYVILHELAHLLEPGHGSRFWALLDRFPRTERARGYLMAIGLEELEE
jgi:predicted metal-dependent hydrolase